MSNEINKKEETQIVKKQDTQVARVLDNQETSLMQSVAIKALELVKPMISSVAAELSDTLGDNETIIVIRTTKKGAPTNIVMLDTSADFTIKGAKANNGKFLFTGAGDPKTKKMYAVRKFYIAEEFVNMLLSGRVQDITKKLME